MPLYGLLCGVEIPCENVAGHLACHTGRAADKVFVVLFQHFVAHPRARIETFYMPRRDYLHQVLVAVVVLGQKDQVVVLVVLLVFDFVVIVPGDVNLAAYDGFDGREACGYVTEILDTEHVAVVGDGKPPLAEFFGALKKGFDVAQSVKDGVLGMDVKVCKRHSAKIHKNARPLKGRANIFAFRVRIIFLP